MSSNKIPTVQNAESQQRLLWARRELYARGKHILTVQLFLTIAVPMVGSVAALWLPQIKPAIAFLSLIIAVLDPTILDRWQKNIRKTTAKMQEQFDCTVLQLQWDQFTAGDRVDRETVHGFSLGFRPDRPDPTLLNWYPAVVGQAPLHLARIICQRTNLWYDGTLRRLYAGWSLALTIVLTLVLLVFAMWNGLTVESFVLSVLAPASPIMIWGLREFYRQRDTADSLDHLKSAADSLWDRAKSGSCSEEACTIESRQFQNAIFDRRNSSTLIFSWIYNLRRNSLEARMNRSAEELVGELLLDK